MGRDPWDADAAEPMDAQLENSLTCRGSWLRGWWAVLLVVPPVLLAASPFAMERLRSSEVSAPDSDVPEPGLDCVSPHVDLGIVESASLEVTFSLRNHSGQPVRIARLRRSCRCVEAVASSGTIPPASTAEISVAVEVIPKAVGAATEFHERVEVHSTRDGVPLEPVLLTITGTYVPPVYLGTPRITIEVDDREDLAVFDGGVDVFVNARGDVEILEVMRDGLMEFDAEWQRLETLANSGYERYRVRVSGTVDQDALPSTGAVTIRTSSDAAPEIRVPVIVYQPRQARIVLRPSRVAFGIVPAGEERERTLEVEFPGASQYAIEETGSRMRGITMELDDGGVLAPDRLRLRCRLTTDALPANKGLDGTVRLKLVGQGDRRVCRIPVSAFVAGP